MSEPAGGGRSGLPQSLGKLFFRIGEVAELVGVEPHVLRYWEREFRTVRPTKSAKGQRVYSRRDVESLMRVRELLYKEGFTIAGARKKLQHPGAEPAVATERSSGRGEGEREPDATQETRKQLLAMRKDIEEFLAELRPRPDGPRR
jgi:DNA-binding transcriptional MerR regulator